MIRDALGVSLFIAVALPVLVWAMAGTRFLRGGALLFAASTFVLAGAVRLVGASPALATIAYLLCLLLASTLLLAGAILALVRKRET